MGHQEGSDRVDGGTGVALTYLCRVLHATPISPAAETNPLCACHAGWIEVTRYADLVRVLRWLSAAIRGDANQPVNIETVLEPTAMLTTAIVRDDLATLF